LQLSVAARSFGCGSEATLNMIYCCDERANKAMQRTRDKIGPDGESKVASR
jgi:hypothetical protein